MMIEINLVPERLRKKKRKPLGGASMAVPREVLVGAVGGVGILLLVLVAGLQVMIMNQMKTKKALEEEIASLGEGKVKVDKIIGELKTLRSKVAEVEKVVRPASVVWAQKFNAISDHLPRGVWLTRLIFEDETLRLYGRSVSKTGDAFSAVHQFVANLQKDEAFLSGLEDIEPGLIKQSSIKDVPIVEFTITAGVSAEELTDED